MNGVLGFAGASRETGTDRNQNGSRQATAGEWFVVHIISTICTFLPVKFWWRPSWFAGFA